MDSMEMEENLARNGEIRGIRFGLAMWQEIKVASNNDFPIGHSSQLSNPFLGLPLQFGRCESCGASEPDKCEGHFGYVELPIPIYHPYHVSELKRMLSLVCLKCLKLKKNKFITKKSADDDDDMVIGSSNCCETLSRLSIKEVKNSSGACYLELRYPSRSKRNFGFWNFLEVYGFRYDGSSSRPLLPYEVMVMLKKMPPETRKKLSSKGYYPQEGYILQYLPVPPNCLSIPDISDGFNITSSDHSLTMLKKVIKQIEIIRATRSGTPNFQAHEIEANELQLLVTQYLEVRGTTKASREVDKRFSVNKESNDSSTKAWLEKMRTLFIKKGSGFSSRSVITGDSYKGVNEIGIPFEIAQKITFEETVNSHNMNRLQELVDENLCLTYKDGSSTYSLMEGSKGHTLLKIGQVVHRRIMDGDTVFINRPPTTHKHSLQALSVYVHDDHTVKINPLICGPLGADFDGDCVHLFYPQSLSAKAEVEELFAVDKQLLSSHTGSLNLQATTDSLLSIRTLFGKFFFDQNSMKQLAMFISRPLPPPCFPKSESCGPLWTAAQILQLTFPDSFVFSEDRLFQRNPQLQSMNAGRELTQFTLNEIVTSIFSNNGPKEVVNFFNILQPLLMEFLYSEGFSVGLEDFLAPLESIEGNMKDIFMLLVHLQSTNNELVELQLENYIQHAKKPIADFILKSSALGRLIDSKSTASINKVVQQVGFLGLQITEKGRFYSKDLVQEMSSFFRLKCPVDRNDYPYGEYGFIKSGFFHGLNPYEQMVHSICSREVIVRSSRGLSEPGTLFKNLMAVLRDVVICYDETVRNVCSNSIIQFNYGFSSLFPPGEPVGVLAATAMSNPAYKAVLDSSPSSNSSWDLMKEILLSKSNFKNDLIDRRIILFLNECGCGGMHCGEKAALVVKNHLKRVCLSDIAVEFMIEYIKQQCSDINTDLVAHIHLNKDSLMEMNISMQHILQKCEDKVKSYSKNKKTASLFKKVAVCVSESCVFGHSDENGLVDAPCLKFFFQDLIDDQLEKVMRVLSDLICPVLLETIIKGNHYVSSANIIWSGRGCSARINNDGDGSNGEVALEVVVDKCMVNRSGDPWRILMDCCLPVIHLIDTTRSMPYSIKQVQDLLGISCVFDQAVQRLLTSVGMVSRGVLKEHLILLANNMTCSGSLIGFNVGGYKALCRALSMEIPFTEATLFTPKKCFERAAEKCHMDSLTSIVASCSWGKHVSVGTGSRFDVLWNESLMGSKEFGGMDIYSFLQLIGGGGRAHKSSACLGDEIDDIMLDDRMSLSPEHGREKMEFEESIEIDSNGKENPGFGTSQGWENGSSNQNENQNAWDNDWNKGAEDHIPEQGGWNSKKDSESDTSNWGKDGGESKAQCNSYSNWQQNDVQAVQMDGENGNHGNWNKGRGGEDVHSQWGAADNGSRNESSDNWADKLNKTEEKTSPKWDNSWGKQENNPQLGQQEPVESNKETEKPTSFNKSWGNGAVPNWDNDFNTNDEKTAFSQNEEQSRKGKHQQKNQWANEKSPGDGYGDGGSGWTDSSQSKRSDDSNPWNQPSELGVNKNRDASGYDGGGESWNENNNKSAWGEKQDSCTKISQSGNRGSWDPTSELNQLETSHDRNSSHMGSPKEGDFSQWGQKNMSSSRKNFDNSSGWGFSNQAERKGRNQSGSGGYRALTATRQRLDLFTSEEEVILSDVEPVMFQIRIIRSKSSNGEPLSDEYQKYVIENILYHHPNKEKKIGSGIDYIMMDMHSEFQDSRCFYIVTKDGTKEDFSAIKCIYKYVMEKYPQLGEAFLSKYFLKSDSITTVKEVQETQEDDNA